MKEQKIDQTSVLSDGVENYDQKYRMRQKYREEKQCNGQNLKKLKYHFEREENSFKGMKFALC